MPSTKVVLFKGDDQIVPFLLWLDTLPAKVRDKIIVRVERLAELGHELRRPESDFLADGVHELRIGYGHVNYRALYFFSRGVAVISHGITKEKEVPDGEVRRAVTNRALYEKDPLRHSESLGT